MKNETGDDCLPMTGKHEASTPVIKSIGENSLVVSQNIKHRVTIGPCHPTPRYPPKRMENICLHKNLSVNVHSSVIHNSQEVGKAPMSITW